MRTCDCCLPGTKSTRKCVLGSQGPSGLPNRRIAPVVRCIRTLCLEKLRNNYVSPQTCFAAVKLSRAANNDGSSPTPKVAG